MKHLIWALPLMLATILIVWCFKYPMAGSGREFLGLLLTVIAGIGWLYIEAIENDRYD